ncbi:MAG: choice-of-anchor Q domain-containing protein [Acidimicrobiales bacterium]
MSRLELGCIPGRAAAALRRRGRGRFLTVIVAAIVVLGGIGAAFAVPAGASGNTLYVSSGGTDTGDCMSPASACATITDALTQANPGDTIEVSGTIDDNPTVTIPVTITQMSGGNPAVVDGGTNGSSVFVILSKQRIEVTLDGLMLENGESNVGGGIAVYGNSTLTVTDSIIAGNTASGGQGGGIYNAANSTVNVVDSTVSGNTDSAGGQGGGIYNDGTVTVTNSTLSANTAEGGGQGAGIYSDGTATVTDSTVSGNTAPGGGLGAGIYNSGTATVTDSTIADNTIPGPGAGEGGGIYNSGAATIADSTISGNAALNGGQGGGIYSGPGNVLQILQQATSPSNGSINLPQQCLNCGLQAAQSAVLAGDILATPGGAPAGTECAGSGFTDAGYNVDDDGTCGLSDPSVSDSATIDSFLGSLADNGGPTDTIALLPGSLAAPDPAQAVIPAGFTAPGLTSSSCSDFDQRGIGRGTPCDMGAYALTTPTITSADTATFTAGKEGTFQIVANSSSSTTFSETGTLPSGVSLSPSGLLSGMPGPGTGGSYPITVTAFDGPLTDTTQGFTLIVQGPPVITSYDSATFTVGEPGTFLVTTTGVPTPALSEIGTLPTGVTFTDDNNGTATVTGTPGSGTEGVYFVGIVAINGTNPPAINTLTLTVDLEPSITSGQQAGFTLGQPGSFTVTTTGYPVAALRVNGVLPDGLSVTDNGDGTATISGTPHHLTGSPVTLSVQAADAAGSVTSPLAVTVSTGKAWLAGSDGAIYPVGTATSFGSMQAYKLNNPVVGMAATPDGGGYWMVASDGGVFNYGDAAFYGSTGGIHLNQPIVGMAATPDGGGYWLVASDGGVFNYGDAAFYGSMATGGSGSLIAPVVGITSSADGRGYSLATSSEDVVPFGDGVAGGGLNGARAPIVGISSP